MFIVQNFSLTENLLPNKDHHVYNKTYLATMIMWQGSMAIRWQENMAAKSHQFYNQK